MIDIYSVYSCYRYFQHAYSGYWEIQASILLNYIKNFYFNKITQGAVVNGLAEV